jgi:hypothetical protein
MFYKGFVPTRKATAKDLAADDAAYVNELNALKGSLRKDFDDAFGTDALEKYYMGSTKVPKYGEDELPMMKNGKPWLISKPFNPHFSHEQLADELGIKFGPLHANHLWDLYRSVSLYLKTQNPIYNDIAEDLFEEFKIAAKANRLDDFSKDLTEEDFEQVSEAIRFAANTMIEHCQPLSLRLSNLVDVNDPGPEAPN